jgi:DNA-binding MarR family transcriptional regulator
MTGAATQELDQEETANRLFQSLNKVSHRLRSVGLPRGFTPERLRTLATIHAHGPISVTGLAAMERVRPATVSRMIASLEGEGLIKRSDVKHDKRSVLISTTAKGRQMYLRENREYLKRIGEAIRGLDSEQVGLVRNLAALLEQLSAALDRYGTKS